MVWPIGSLCVIHGLQSDAGQQLNERLGEVRGMDEATGRLLQGNEREELPVLADADSVEWAWYFDPNQICKSASEGKVAEIAAARGRMPEEEEVPHSAIGGR